MQYKLKKAEDEILRLAVEAVAYAKKLCGDIEFSPRMLPARNGSSFSGW
jgi:2-isopropylmalate synthase